MACVECSVTRQWLYGQCCSFNVNQPDEALEACQGLRSASTIVLRVPKPCSWASTAFSVEDPKEPGFPRFCTRHRRSNGHQRYRYRKQPQSQKQSGLSAIVSSLHFFIPLDVSRGESSSFGQEPSPRHDHACWSQSSSRSSGKGHCCVAQPLSCEDCIRYSIGHRPSLWARLIKCRLGWMQTSGRQSYYSVCRAHGIFRQIIEKTGLRSRAPEPDGLDNRHPDLLLLQRLASSINPVSLSTCANTPKSSTLVVICGILYAHGASNTKRPIVVAQQTLSPWSIDWTKNVVTAEKLLSRCTPIPLSGRRHRRHPTRRTTSHRRLRQALRDNW